MAAQQWGMDIAHSQVGFRVRHMMFAKVRGEFKQWEGEVTFDPEDLSSLEVDVQVDVSSIETGNTDRDNHLRSEDFFDAENHPSIHFASKGIEVEGDKFQLAGDLTIRDQTHPIILKGERTGQGKDPWGNNRVGYRAEAKINRKDFGLTWNQALETGGVLVGEDVEIEIEIQTVEQ